MSGKINFDKVVNEGLNKISRKDQIDDTIKCFREFIDEEIPKEVNAYEWEGNETLIKVFKYIPKTHGALDINLQGDTTDVSKVRYYSFAKILAVGPESKYKQGQIVKLRDTDTLTIESAKYKQWVNNPMSKSNLKQQGEEPLRYVSNIHANYAAFTFILNPFDLNKLDEHVDDCIYKVSDSKIENPVKDVELLLNNI